MSILSTSTLDHVHHAAIDASISRDTLLAGVDPTFSSTLPAQGDRAQQLFSDLGQLDRAGVLVDGAVPLRVWLKNAALRAGPTVQGQAFKDALVELAARFARPLLPDGELARLRDAAIGAGLHRDLLLSDIDPAFTATLPVHPDPSSQLLGDLGALNHAGIVDGVVALQVWLHNAGTLAGVRVESLVFGEAAMRLSAALGHADAGREADAAVSGAGGATLWAQAFGTDGEGTAVAVDADGNVFLAGYFSHLLELGDQQLTADSGTGGFLAKLDGAGHALWSRSFGGSQEARVSGVAVDGVGNVFITGYFNGHVSFGAGHELSGEAGGYPGFVASFDAVGNCRWAAGVGETPSGQGKGVAIDPSGDVWVVGDHQQTQMFLERRAGLDGHEVWRASIPSPNVQARGVAVDPTTGSVVVTGSFQGTLQFATTPGAPSHPLTSVEDTDAFLAAFDASGSCAWSLRLGGASSQYGGGVAVTADGAVTTGSFCDTIAFGSARLEVEPEADAMYVGGIDGGGAVRWAKAFTASCAPRRPRVAGAGIAVDRQGSVVVVGHSDGEVDFGDGAHAPDSGDYCVLVTKLDGSGRLLWSRTFKGRGDTEGNAVAVSPSGDIVIAGNGSVTDFGLARPVRGSIFLAKLSP